MLGQVVIEVALAAKPGDQVTGVYALHISSGCFPLAPVSLIYVIWESLSIIPQDLK